MENTRMHNGIIVYETGIGETIDTAASVIHEKWFAGTDDDTHRLLTDPVELILKKIVEQSTDIALTTKDLQAAKGANASHAYMERVPAMMQAMQQSREAMTTDALHYEIADMIVNLMVLMERLGISVNELDEAFNERLAKLEGVKEPEGASAE